MKFPKIICLFVCLVFSCSRTTSSDKLILKPIRTGEGKASIAIEKAKPDTLSETLPFLTFHDNKQTVLVTNIDLDQDDLVEQIIIRKEGEHPLQIVILKASLQNDTYYKVYENVLSTNNPRDLVVFAEDLTGDHKTEIIVTGLKNDGEQFMDIFYDTSDERTTRRQYKQALRLQSPGTIDIIREQRNESYEELMDIGADYAITTQELSIDPLSKQQVYLVTTYKWNFDKKIYEKQEESFIPLRPEDSSHTKINLENDEKIYEFLQGTWARLNSENKMNLSDILFFDSGANEINFFTLKVQEVYTILSLRKTFYQSLILHTENTYLPSLKRDFYINVKNKDMLIVKAYGHDVWEHSYARMGEEQAASLLPEGSFYPMQKVLFNGPFKNDRGIEIFLDPPEIIWTENMISTAGVVSFYKLNEPVMEIRLGNDDQNRKTTSYIYQFNQEKINNREEKILLLTKGNLTLEGIRASGEPPLRFEQIIYNSNEQKP